MMSHKLIRVLKQTSKKLKNNDWPNCLKLMPEISTQLASTKPWKVIKPSSRLSCQEPVISRTRVINLDINLGISLDIQDTMHWRNMDNTESTDNMDSMDNTDSTKPSQSRRFTASPWLAAHMDVVPWMQMEFR